VTTKSVDIGDRERLTVTFTDISGTLTNPTTVVVTVREPDGTSTAFSTADSPQLVINGSTGVYYLDHTHDQEGRHFFEFVGTGVLVAAVSGERWVRRSNVT